MFCVYVQVVLKFYQVKFNHLHCKFEECINNKLVLKIERSAETFSGYVKCLVGGGGEEGGGSQFCYELLPKKMDGEGYKLYFYATVSKNYIMKKIEELNVSFVTFCIFKHFLQKTLKIRIQPIQESTFKAKYQPFEAVSSEVFPRKGFLKI